MISRMLKALCILLLVAPGVWAQQYRWVDEKGRVHYTDTPPPPSAKDAQKKNLKGSELGQQESYEMMEAVRKAPVTLRAALGKHRFTVPLPAPRY